MSIIRKDAGEIRLVWRLVLIILLYVSAAVLLRLIPISLIAAFLVGNGMKQANAIELARTIVFEDPVWSTAVGVLNGLMGFLIVWFLVQVIERSGFTWAEVGLNWRNHSPLVILLGALLALLLFIASMLTGYVLGSIDFSLISRGMDVSAPVFFQKFVLYLAMGFGEEIIFRGYVQTRLVERYRAIWGILITAVVFVLLHQISYSLSPVIILSGVMLWTTIGSLYHWSKSLYLVSVFHGTMNTLLNTLHFEFSDFSSLVVHALMLLLVIIVALVKSRGSGIRLNPI